MKKILKLATIVVICVVIILLIIFLLNKMYIKKIEKIYYSKIKNELNIDTNFKIKSIEKYEDKMNNIEYRLDLGKIDRFNIYVQISNIDKILEPNENTIIKINIEDFEIAQKLYDRYGSNYEIVEVTVCKISNSEDVISLKYNGAYKFEMKNIYTENKLTGYIPSNKNIDDMFEMNEREDLDFEF